MMQQLGIGGIDDTIAALAQPVAVIRVIVGHRETLFIESADLQKQHTACQQTGSGHCGAERCGEYLRFLRSADAK